jgi:hypothetical protein
MESFAAHSETAGDTFWVLIVAMLSGALGAPPFLTSWTVFAIGSMMRSITSPDTNVMPVLPKDVLFIEVPPSAKIPKELPPPCPR